MKTIFAIAMLAVTAGCTMAGPQPPVLRSTFTTNDWNGVIARSSPSNVFEIGTVSQTNQIVITTNGMIAFKTNRANALLDMPGPAAADNPAGNGANGDRGFLLYAPGGGNGSANGGNAVSATGANVISGGLGGIGTNGSGGAGGAVAINSGSGGTGNLSGGFGGRFFFQGGDGGFGTNSGGGGGLIQARAGNGGDSVTNNGASGGSVNITAGAGGSSQKASGGNAGASSFQGAAGGSGNLNGGTGSSLNLNAGAGGFGTNSGAAAGTIALTGRTGGGAKTNTAGTGSSITATAGNGGDSTLGFGGDGGNMTVTLGNGGTGVTNGNGGSFYVEPGTGNSNGVVALGMTSGGVARGWVGYGTSQGFNPINAFASFMMGPASATPIVLGGGGPFVTITNYSAQVTNYFVGSTNQGNLTNLIAGYYRININSSVDTGVSPGSHIHGHLFTNGVECPIIGFETDNGATLDTIHGGACAIIYLPASSQISFRMEDLGSGGTFTIIHADLTVGTP